MEIITFEELKNTPTTISYIEAIKVKSNLEVNNYHYPNTPYSHFLYAIKGNANYIYRGRIFNIIPRSLTYIPAGSSPYFNEDSDYEYIKIYFRLLNQSTSEEIIFSDNIVTMFEKTPENIRHELFSLCHIYPTQSVSYFKLYSIFFSLMDNIYTLSLTTPEQPVPEFSISPALLHIQNNFQYHFTTKDLADMCLLSESYFRKLFRETMNSSPTEYRNFLRINKACNYLTTSNASVQYVSELCGFENITHFYRTFKHFLGISPTEYKKRISRYKSNPNKKRPRAD